MTTHLDNITTIIDTYTSLSIPTAHNVSDLLRSLTSELFYLEKHRAEYHTKYNSIMLSRKGSVAAATIEANKEVPELYLLRRIMNAAYRVTDSMRSNISTINKEK
tara:strand:+ start:345 stop:659 length:315 start_codon:yes stop_codon:yes gene_type:complete